MGRLILAALMVFMANNAYAHGEDAFLVWFGVPALSLIGFVIFLSLWKAPLKRKAILFLAYVFAYPLVWPILFWVQSLAPELPVAFSLFVGFPLAVWILGAWMLRVKPNHTVEREAKLPPL